MDPDRCADDEGAKRWSAVATVAKIKEVKKRYGAEEGRRIDTSVLERAVAESGCASP